MLLAVARLFVYTDLITMWFSFYCMLMYKKQASEHSVHLFPLRSKNACAVPGVIFLYTKHCTSILNV